MSLARSCTCASTTTSGRTRSRHREIWRILKRLDLNRLPANQRHKTHDRRWKRYEKPLPDHQIQIDVKFIEPVAGRE